jgi:hypothetical protein
MNITRMNLYQGTIFGYAAWYPVPTIQAPPKIQPPYYSLVYIADLLGIGSATQVQSFNLGLDKFSAFAVYEQGILSKYALINVDVTTQPPYMLARCRTFP